MQWWEWIGVVLLPAIGAGATKLGPVLLGLLSGKAEQQRKDREFEFEERRRYEKGLQDTIDALRIRLDKAEKDIRECLEDRASLRQKILDLENKNK